MACLRSLPRCRRNKRHLLFLCIQVDFNMYHLLYMFVHLSLEDPMRIVNFSDARSNLRTVIDQVVDDADVTVIARRDAPDAVLMSFDHYSSLLETVHLLSSPANAAHLAQSIAQARAGHARQRDLIEGTGPA